MSLILTLCRWALISSRLSDVFIQSARFCEVSWAVILGHPYFVPFRGSDCSLPLRTPGWAGPCSGGVYWTRSNVFDICGKNYFLLSPKCASSTARGVLGSERGLAKTYCQIYWSRTKLSGNKVAGKCKNGDVKPVFPILASSSNGQGLISFSKILV